MGIYDFTVLNTDGDKVSLGDYRDKVVLIINSATLCGFTPQYDGLQDLYEKYADQGFVILDFPCNQFGNQAPGTNEEIATFCDSKYGVTFPIFSKIDVNGENADPLYKFLKGEKEFLGLDPDHKLTSVLEGIIEKMDPKFRTNPEIKWNFTKFLIDKSGNVVERFEPTTDLGYVEERIKELL